MLVDTAFQMCCGGLILLGLAWLWFRYRRSE